MPAVLDLKPEEIDTRDKRGKYAVCVVGCGQKGITYATGFAEAGFKIVCTDPNQSIVKRLMKGKSVFFDHEAETKLKGFLSKGILTATNDLKAAVAQSDVIILTIAGKIDEKKHVDFSEAEHALRQVGAAFHRGALVVYGGIVGVGFMEDVAKESLENTSGLKIGADFGLAYNPLPSHAEPASSMEFLVAADDERSLQAASLVLSTLTSKGVKKTLGFRALEAAALFASSRRDVNTALSNEFAVLCEKAGVDYYETIKLVGIGDGESELLPANAEGDNKNGAYVLLENAENFNGTLRLPALARQINDGMIRHAVCLTQEILRSGGKSLRRARIAVLGSAGLESCSQFVKMLEAKGAKVSLYDPLFSKNAAVEAPSVMRRTLNEAVEGSDCIVILTLLDQFRHLNFKNCHALMRTSPAIVDLVGIYNPGEIEGEGFIYRGLGRGTGKK